MARCCGREWKTGYSFCGRCGNSLRMPPIIELLQFLRLQKISVQKTLESFVAREHPETAARGFMSTKNRLETALLRWSEFTEALEKTLTTAGSELPPEPEYKPRKLRTVTVRQKRPTSRKPRSSVIKDVIDSGL